MRTLVIRLSSLGDVLLSTAILRGLKAIDPQGVIDICTRPAYREIFAANPFVHAIIPFDDQTPSLTYSALRSGEIYDCVIDLHNNFRTRILRRDLGTHTLVIQKRTFEKWMLVHARINLLRKAPDVIGRYIEALERLEIVDEGATPEFYPVDTSLPSGVERFMSDQHVIGICPGARHFTKRWPAERFADFCSREIEQYGKRIVVFGGEMDESTCASIESAVRSDLLHNACNQLSLSQIALAMDRCEVIVTNDSGLMHLAAARNRPIVAVFGSTVREFGFVPRHATTVVEVKELSCRPCSHIGRDSCPKGHFKCMLEIDVPRVMEAVHHRI